MFGIGLGWIGLDWIGLDWVGLLRANTGRNAELFFTASCVF